MKANGDYELSDVPRLMRYWEDSDGQNPLHLLRARQALTDACGDMIEASSKESRGLTTDERGSFDECMNRSREINAALAKFKAERIAMHGADQVHLPF